MSVGKMLNLFRKGISLATIHQLVHAGEQLAHEWKRSDFEEAAKAVTRYFSIHLTEMLMKRKKAPTKTCQGMIDFFLSRYDNFVQEESERLAKEVQK